jgi:Spy/CpxP family protein refolding chaperone
MKKSHIALLAIPAVLVAGLIAHKKFGGRCGSFGPSSCGGGSFEHGSHGPCGGGPGGVAFEKFKALRRDLDLSLIQKFKIIGTVKGFKESLKAQFAAGKSAREGMRSAVQQHGADSPEVQAAAAVLAGASQNRALLFAKIAEAIRPILSDEQAAKFEVARAEFEAMIQSKLDQLG